MARIALINRADVSAEAIADICEAARLPDGDIRLIVGARVADEFQAATFARRFAPLAGDLFGLEEFLGEPWDCGVVVGSRWSQRQREYPAYFAYLLGHEFGHASTVLTNLALTVYEDLVLRYIREASGGKIQRWDEVPHEIAYDRFGMAVVDHVFGRPFVEAEFGRLVASGLLRDQERVEKALTLDPSTDLRSLRRDIAVFAEPYRQDLVTRWAADRQAGGLRIADGLSDLEILWRDAHGGTAASA